MGNGSVTNKQSHNIDDSDYEIGEPSKQESNKSGENDVDMEHQPEEFAAKMKQLEEALGKMQIENEKLVMEKTKLEGLNVSIKSNIDEFQSELAQRGIFTMICLLIL